MSEGLPITGSDEETLDVTADGLQEASTDTDPDMDVLPVDSSIDQTVLGDDVEISKKVLEGAAELALQAAQEKGATPEEGRSLFRQLITSILSLPKKKAAAL